jgi:hypothetical protein
MFKFVQHLVEKATKQIMKQVNIVQEAVTAPLRSLVNEVMGGMWKGQGANRFVQEMTSEVIPLLISIIGLNTSFANSITKGINRTNQAINQATNKAQTLFDTFKIF